MLWTWDALRVATDGTGAVPFDADGVSIDSRTVQPGDLFVALQGDTDGHAHVAAALARGAAGAMVHRMDGLPENAPLLLVPDTLDGLHALGRGGRDRFQGRVVAVTGSVGKTTTKEMLRAALAPFGTVHAAEASYNNHWGVPLTLARMPPGAAFCVAEIGMNHPGEIAPLARMARPDVAVITTIAAAHIGHLGSLDAIADEKAAILQGLIPGGVAVLPGDSPFLTRMAADAPGRVVTFGQGDTNDARLLPLSPRKRPGVSATNGTGLDPAIAHTQPSSGGKGLHAVILGTPVAFDLIAPGQHMATNAVAALAACAALGLDPVQAAAALSHFAPIAGRGLQRRVGEILLLDESYNASSASIRAALHVLADLPGRRVAVLGDMLELGAFGPGEHEDLAPDVTSCADLLYSCGPLMRRLYDRVPSGHRGAHAADSAALAPLVAAAVLPGDAVLVKGSLGSRMQRVVAALEAPSPPGWSPGNVR